MQETPRDNLWQIYTTINEWIRFADTKAGVALAAHGAVFTVAMPAIMKEKQYFSQHPFLTCNMVFCTLCAVVSVFYGIRCILPRLNVGEARSLIFLLISRKRMIIRIRLPRTRESIFAMLMDMKCRCWTKYGPMPELHGQNTKIPLSVFARSWLK